MYMWGGRKKGGGKSLPHVMGSYDINLYSVSLSSGSDVSTQMQLLSVCTHSLFLRARKPVCAISLGAHDLALRLANKCTTSLPEDSETECSDILLLVGLILLYPRTFLSLIVTTHNLHFTQGAWP